MIGAGVAAQTHARELAKVSGAKLISVLARDSEKAAAFVAAFSIPDAYTELDLFLSDRQLDAVIITTPNGTHRDYALAVAQAGKQVIIEKPLEISSCRAQQIIDACKAAQVGLYVIYQRVFSQAARQALADVQAGKLGKLLLVNIVDNQYRHHDYYQRAAWRGTHQLEGGGCVITQTTHLIDLAQYLLGPVSAVFATTATHYHHIATEDTAVALLQFDNGVFATLSSSTAAYPGQRHLLTLSGTRGCIIINGEHDQIVYRCCDQEGETHSMPAAFSFADPQDPRDYPTHGQRIQLQHITDALLRGEISCDDRALLSVRVVEGIYRSAAQQRLIKL
ncbi:MULTISPECIES: Gfo/Idh/MocA family protein [unclassified Erwinia]|uniref:Gfo/Idh/MocA family protein n=1 Tax=unclassified Erwinia TaxID=2622719 RepID=UPI00211023A7|nr:MULTISPECIES: Gfo/Idh/MocA family oxidoreductase [unclassified Erwinia]